MTSFGKKTSSPGGELVMGIIYMILEKSKPRSMSAGLFESFQGLNLRLLHRVGVPLFVLARNQMIPATEFAHSGFFG